MTNKYLEKIAAAYPTLDYMDKAEIQSKARAAGAKSGLIQGTVGLGIGSVVGGMIGHRYDRAGAGAAIGAAALGYMGHKRGLATGHAKSLQVQHDALKKQANEHVKDLKDTATIGALGGVASIGTHHLLTTGRVGRAIESMSSKRKLGTIAAVGTGVGLLADYAGLKLNKATDKLLPQNKTKEQNVPL